MYFYLKIVYNVILKEIIMINRYRNDKSNSMFSTGNKDKSTKNIKVYTKTEVAELNKKLNNGG